MFYSKVFQSSTRRCFSSKSIVLSERVKQALYNHEPLVALESTIITHGKYFGPKGWRNEFSVKENILFSTLRQWNSVTLEITDIYSHPKIGMPKPHNVSCAKGIEKIIASNVCLSFNNTAISIVLHSIWITILGCSSCHYSHAKRTSTCWPFQWHVRKFGKWWKFGQDITSGFSSCNFQKDVWRNHCRWNHDGCKQSTYDNMSNMF